MFHAQIVPSGASCRLRRGQLWSPTPLPAPFPTVRPRPTYPVNHLRNVGSYGVAAPRPGPDTAVPPIGPIGGTGGVRGWPKVDLVPGPWGYEARGGVRPGRCSA
ncbi:hypothetical protein GCM10010259_31930 [Streptomyces daghestanicus]|uniref:Uncharacterized protein n=2 Tax=Streptomyces TaxID=1883 RepID=A0A918LK67_STRGD|nr:hypothetical protein GCM10010238_56580 [Streptomyces niveoruber]GGU38942.1 hypothetical protein GCM10010259_31930 [Streptomyces daghestanicus]GHI30752.1 hypothetical protein Sdagh_24820 [Streptomyces daghestanicus]